MRISSTPRASAATLHQLRVFDTVARLSSFSRAAESLHLTQPTVSMLAGRRELIDAAVR